MKGFSSSNLKYMRFFAQQCPSCLIGQQPADQLPWFHLVTLLTKVSSESEREWYATQTLAQGWSRLTLELNIKNQLYQLVKALPQPLDTNLPSIEQIEEELSGGFEDDK